MSKHKITDSYCLKNSLTDKIIPISIGSNIITQTDILQILNIQSIPHLSSLTLELIDIILNEDNEVLIKLTSSELIHFEASDETQSKDITQYNKLDINEKVLFSYLEKKEDNGTMDRIKGCFYCEKVVEERLCEGERSARVEKPEDESVREDILREGGGVVCEEVKEVGNDDKIAFFTNNELSQIIDEFMSISHQHIQEPTSPPQIETITALNESINNPDTLIQTPKCNNEDIELKEDKIEQKKVIEVNQSLHSIDNTPVKETESYEIEPIVPKPIEEFKNITDFEKDIQQKFSNNSLFRFRIDIEDNSLKPIFTLEDNCKNKYLNSNLQADNYNNYNSNYQIKQNYNNNINGGNYENINGIHNYTKPSFSKGDYSNNINFNNYNDSSDCSANDEKHCFLNGNNNNQTYININDSQEQNNPQKKVIKSECLDLEYDMLKPQRNIFTNDEIENENQDKYQKYNSYIKTKKQSTPKLTINHNTPQNNSLLQVPKNKYKKNKQNDYIIINSLDAKDLNIVVTKNLDLFNKILILKSILNPNTAIIPSKRERKLSHNSINDIVEKDKSYPRNSRKNSFNNDFGNKTSNIINTINLKTIQAIPACSPVSPIKILNQKNCRICLEKIKKLTKLNKCEHEFCNACILEWGNVSNTCPICKTEFTKLIMKDTVMKMRKKRLKMEEEEEEPWMYSCMSNCMICKKSNDNYLLLVCDKCHYNVCHTYCDNLEKIPDEDWICMKCRSPERWKATKQQNRRIGDFNNKENNQNQNPINKTHNTNKLNINTTTAKHGVNTRNKTLNTSKLRSTRRSSIGSYEDINKKIDQIGFGLRNKSKKKVIGDTKSEYSKEEINRKDNDIEDEEENTDSEDNEESEESEESEDDSEVERVQYRKMPTRNQGKAHLHQSSSKNHYIGNKRNRDEKMDLNKELKALNIDKLPTISRSPSLRKISHIRLKQLNINKSNNTSTLRTLRNNPKSPIKLKSKSTTNTIITRHRQPFKPTQKKKEKITSLDALDSLEEKIKSRRLNRTVSNSNIKPKSRINIVMRTRHKIYSNKDLRNKDEDSDFEEKKPIKKLIKIKKIVLNQQKYNNKHSNLNRINNIQSAKVNKKTNRIIDNNIRHGTSTVNKNLKVISKEMKSLLMNLGKTRFSKKMILRKKK